MSLRPLPGRPLDWDGQAHGPCAAVPFPVAEGHPMHAAGWVLLRHCAERAPVVPVPLAALVATQEAVGLAQLRRMTPLMVRTAAPPPLVVRWRGVLYLNDGHHRATAAWLCGEREIAAHLLDLDALLNN